MELSLLSLFYLGSCLCRFTIILSFIKILCVPGREHLSVGKRGPCHGWERGSSRSPQEVLWTLRTQDTSTSEQLLIMPPCWVSSSPQGQQMSQSRAEWPPVTKHAVPRAAGRHRSLGRSCLSVEAPWTRHQNRVGELADGPRQPLGAAGAECGRHSGLTVFHELRLGPSLSSSS